MGEIVKTNGEVNGTVKYLGQAGDKWLGVPSSVGSQIKGPCSRIDLMKSLAGIDVQEMYPAGSAPKADNWTLETFLKAAEACHKGGKAFGIGLGGTTDSVDTAGAFFHAHGAMETLVYFPINGTQVCGRVNPDAGASDGGNLRMAAHVLTSHGM